MFIGNLKHAPDTLECCTKEQRKMMCRTPLQHATKTQPPTAPLNFSFLLYRHRPNIKRPEHRAQQEREERDRRSLLSFLEHAEYLLHRHAQHLRRVRADQERSGERSHDTHEHERHGNQKRFIRQRQNELREQRQPSHADVLRALDHRRRNRRQSGTEQHRRKRNIEPQIRDDDAFFVKNNPRQFDSDDFQHPCQPAVIAEQVNESVRRDHARDEQRNHIRFTDQIDHRPLIEAHVDRQRIADQQHQHARNRGYPKRKDDIATHAFVRKQIRVPAQIVPALAVAQAHDERLDNRNNDDDQEDGERGKNHRQAQDRSFSVFAHRS